MYLKQGHLTVTRSDILLRLALIASTDNAKEIVKVAKQCRAKYGHLIPQGFFTLIINADNPADVVMGAIDQLEKPKPPTHGHGYAQVNAEYVSLNVGVEDNDIEWARKNELDVLEQCAISAVEQLGLSHAVVNVKLFTQYGFTGKLHQFEIGE